MGLRCKTCSRCCWRKWERRRSSSTTTWGHCFVLALDGAQCMMVLETSPRLLLP
jgi:thymidylate synthase ThyX